MTTHDTRRGYTLFELVVVMALLLLLAAVILPSIGAFRGDTRQRAAADAIRGELAVARARAKDEGQPYRVALSEDGARIRRGPESANFGEASGFDHASGSALVVDYPFDHVTAAVVADGDIAAPGADNGWVTIATVQPDGTCREDTALIAIREDDRGTLFLRVRGLTASARLLPPSAANGGNR